MQAGPGRAMPVQGGGRLASVFDGGSAAGGSADCRRRIVGRLAVGGGRRVVGPAHAGGGDVGRPREGRQVGSEGWYPRAPDQTVNFD